MGVRGDLLSSWMRYKYSNWVAPVCVLWCAAEEGRSVVQGAFLHLCASSVDRDPIRARAGDPNPVTAGPRPWSRCAECPGSPVQLQPLHPLHLHPPLTNTATLNLIAHFVY